MARVSVSESAKDDLAFLIQTHSLPESTRRRFVESLAPLRLFPELGAPLGGPFVGHRFLLGPWRWMIVVYRYSLDQDRVAVLRVFDGRISTSPTTNR